VAYPISLRNTISGEQLPAPEIQFVNLDHKDKVEIECLAKNIYYESRGEHKLGWLAVAMVTMNRVNDNFAPDVCSVVKQKTGSICQFSWWCEARRKIHYGNYKRAQDIAVQVYLNYGSMSDITKGATYFHEQSINPGWKNVVKTVKIGHHIFYKKKVYYVEKVKPSFKQQFRSNKELFYAFDGGYITSVMQANN
jgi:hypothetical protein